MFLFIRALFDRIFAVIGALLFIQIPLFIQQYSQSLAGHIDELKYQINIMQAAASETGKTLPQYVDKFVQSGDVDFSNQGYIIQAMIERWQSLSNGLSALQQANVFTKPYVFFSNLNFDIARSTLHSYNFGISLSFEGLMYGIIGIFFGYIFFVVTAFFSGKCIRRFRKKPMGNQKV